jgi:hypothetical protein
MVFNKQWLKKQAYGENYWETDNFPSFLKWYANSIRKDAISSVTVSDIIDIVEKPWKKFYRKQYYNYIKGVYEDALT